MRLVPVILLAIAGCDRACGDETSAAATYDGPPAPPPDDMVLIPAGPFLMGDPPRKVELDAFMIDRTEVTQGDYDACVAVGVCAAIPVIKVFKERPPPRYPVVNVTFGEAATYCTWRGKQLPTETQWEKAARGVDGRTYPWGEDAPTCARALFARWTLVSPSSGQLDACGAKDPHSVTHPVGLHPTGASPYGVLDMAGNVLEWTTSWEGPYRVARGDRVIGGRENELRAAHRKLVLESPDHPDFRMWQNRDPLLGFRCVRTRRGRELPAYSE